MTENLRGLGRVFQRTYKDPKTGELKTMKPWWIEFHHNGKRIVEYRKSWQTATEKVGLIGRIPHDFRRTAVRNLERAGVPRSVAMKLVGHKTESIYRRYAIVARQDLVDELKRLADYRAGLDKTPAAPKVVAITSSLP